MAVGFYFLFFKKRKTLFWGLGGPQKKAIVLLSPLNFSKVANP